jgi:hypothetical protein
MASGNRVLVGLNRFVDSNEETYLGRRNCDYNVAMTHRADRLPVVVYARPEVFSAPDSDVETCETSSASSGSVRSGSDMPEEYRIAGLIWATPGLRNTCNMDSFLSAWIRRVRQTHGRCARLVVTTDIAGVALIEIANYVLESREHTDSRIVKIKWLTAVLTPSGEVNVLRNPVVDCFGVNVCSVFQHLKNHCSYMVVSRCLCGTVYHRDFFFEAPSCEQLRFIGDQKEWPNLRMPKCRRCGQHRLLLQIVLDPDNWLVPVVYNGTGANRNPNLSLIPKFLKFGIKDFKLAYVSYHQLVPGTRMMHEISLQYIRSVWYQYDGLKTPSFCKFTSDVYSERNARLATLVYIKIGDGDDS